jgi:hypothetical protein
MADPLDELRAKARAHQRDLTERQRASVRQLATLWGVSLSTVRNIPYDELPYLEFGSGARFKRRRYRWEDVAGYEARKLTQGPAGRRRSA